jgi:hypothetical protein
MREEITMHALVIYESMFGNTHEVADAIAIGLSRTLTTQVRQAADIDLGTLDPDLVVIGTATHARSMPRPSTREGAMQDTVKHPEHHLEPVAMNSGVRELLAGLPNQRSRFGAAFDTRFDRPKAVTGSAARAVARKMRGLQFELLDGPNSFVVEGMDGPLAEGELIRARAWGETLASTARAHAASDSVYLAR